MFEQAPQQLSSFHPIMYITFTWKRLSLRICWSNALFFWKLHYPNFLKTCNWNCKLNLTRRCFQQFTCVRFVGDFYGFYRNSTLVNHHFSPAFGRICLWYFSNHSVQANQSLELEPFSEQQKREKGTRHRINRLKRKKSFPSMNPVWHHLMRILLRISDGLWGSDDGVFGVLISTLIFTIPPWN